MNKTILAVTLALGAWVMKAAAWDYEGHHAVNELALDTLPANFPAFALTPAAKDRIAYLAGEADRWRNITDMRAGRGLELANASAPDHYLDLEDVYNYDLTPATLPPFRYLFAEAITKARLAHPERFPALDPARDSDHTRELSGFLPWAINENFQKLQSCFSTLNALEKAGGTPAEIENAKEDIIYVMGVMGHFVGDASQPLHTTMHFNGWAGTNNPNHYTTWRGFHAWIDGGFFNTNGGIDVKALAAQVHAAQQLTNALSPVGIFPQAVQFVVDQNKLVEPLYALEHDGKLTADKSKNAEGMAFLNGQLLKSAQFLGDIWLTAYQTAPEDTYLERQLQRRAGVKQPAAPAALKVNNP
jgi:hypothetical protein